ncbi:unnamed protein product [Acanthosepion pharaonis]|uniref:Uncharacterized protein n=1 Tax=Acanthosepion pharaonis TaxID=158019 RepID=A0A812CJJ3_ACAPH|nr:unnamed protein product [Sepia pharaonis]
MPQLAYPLRWTRHDTNPNIPTFEKESFTEGALRLNPNKLVREKPRKNKYCLPTEKEMQRRKELFAEFDRMHNLAQETCDWLVSHEFVVSNNDRRNLSTLMKTCFDPLAFSSLGKKPKEIYLVQQERDRAVVKTVKLAEKERFEMKRKRVREISSHYLFFSSFFLFFLCLFLYHFLCRFLSAFLLLFSVSISFLF